MIGRVVIKYVLIIFFFAAFAMKADQDVYADNAGLVPSYTLFSEIRTGQNMAEQDLFFMEKKEWNPRYKEVHLNRSLTETGMIRKGEKILIDLFDDEQLYAHVTRAFQNINGTNVVIAKMECSIGYLVLATTGQRSLGSIVLPKKGQFYQIIGDPYGFRHYFIDIEDKDLDLLGSYGPIIHDTPKPAYEMESDIHQQWMDHLDPLEHVNIDVMVAYTPAAALWADFHGGGIDNVIAVAMGLAQLVNDNSETYLTLTLVHSGMVDYEESGNSHIDLMRLVVSPEYNPYGNFISGLYIPGFMYEVHQWRNAYHADVCALFTYTQDRGGVATALTNIYGSPHHAFTITRVQQAATSYTHVHEIGHLLGAHHHKEQLSNPGPTDWINWPENRWSAGWRWLGSDGHHYCTVMTYESGNHFSDGITHARLPYFSNPEVFVQDRPVGHPFFADNTHTIRKMKHVVASYRSEGVPFVSTLPVSEPGVVSAYAGGVVVADNGEEVFEKGLVWDTTTFPNLLHYTGKTVLKGEPGEFLSKMTDLEPDTEYTVAAYVTNDLGTSYGHVITFRTQEVVLARVRTGPVSVSGHNHALLKGEVDNAGNTKMIERGFVWDSTPNPTLDRHKGKTREGADLGGFSSYIEGLNPKTTYFYRAYATNQGGTNYGQQQLFTTPVATIFPNPVKSTVNISFQNDSDAHIQLVLYDLFGRKVLQKPVASTGEQEKRLDLSALSSGIYLLRIEGAFNDPVWRILKVDP